MKNGKKENIQVCKEMFLQSFGVSERRMRIVIDKKYEVLPEATEPKRYCHRSSVKKSTHRIKKKAREMVNEHIRSFPTVPSHYCRRYDNKFYFEQGLTQKKMHALFEEKHGTGIVSLTLYKRILGEYDVGIFKPKKDLCSTCNKEQNVYTTDKSEYTKHRERTEAARILKEEQKQRAENDNTNFSAIIVDLAAVDNCPVGPSGDFFYVTKLACYNCQGRIQSNVVGGGGGGGVPELLGVRARRRFAPSSKCDRGSAKRLPRELQQGSGGAKIGLLES